MLLADGWKDYTVIATGDGYKLEKWADYILLRPDPQVIWPSDTDMKNYPGLTAYYTRSSTGGGSWTYLRPMPESFTVGYGNLKFKLKLMGFKHTGLFPEQAVNWDRMDGIIRAAGRPVEVLNLFAYTGGATVACLNAGAKVCHVDSAKAMVERAGENVRLSGLADKPVRYIIDDCIKFCRREIKRGKKYDAVIMDPPSFGRGPGGETWKIENDLFGLVRLTAGLLSDNPLFVLINGYTTGLQPSVMSNIIRLALGRDCKVEADEIGLPTLQSGIVLPAGASAFATF
ncbi:MAG TPA: class I SAM-dependent methyltransferase [Candidatus Faecicola pullistercoris]|nr:class I SAM-dependent methyltransferase [Candidatus Faecicola pullistercoris]